MSRGGGVFDRGAIQVPQGLNVGADRCVCPKSGKCKDESGKLIEIFRFSPFCLMLRLTPSGVDRWFALLRHDMCYDYTCFVILERSEGTQNR